jgi:hypothetical protein
MKSTALRLIGGLLLAAAVVAPAVRLLAPERPPAPTRGGRMIMKYAPLKDRRQFARFEKLFKQAGNIASSVQDVNDQLHVPFDVTVALQECGDANAFYDGEKRTLTLCYELAKDMERVFKKDAKNRSDLDDLVLAGMEFIFHHELGHAVVDMFDLPVVGREEDAVDELATLIYIRSDDEDTALIAADEFLNEGMEEARDSADQAFWDEHSLSQQRYYTIACLVIGSDLNKHKDLLKQLPELRDRDCEAEFAQKDRAWDKLLKPYLKNRTK